MRIPTSVYACAELLSGFNNLLHTFVPTLTKRVCEFASSNVFLEKKIKHWFVCVGNV